MSNLKLWEAVEKTDPKYTKPVNQRGGYTAISPQYQLKIATEQFGSYGEGFGLSESEFDFSLLDLFGAVIHKAKFFYQSESGRVEFPITNSMKLTSGKNNYFDEDFAKKIETNTVSKALSKLGFNADVFMGLFELDGYQEYAANEIAAEANEKAAEEALQNQIDYEAWRDKALEAFGIVKTMQALTVHYNGCVTKANKYQDNEGLQMFNEAAQKVKESLESNNE